jgi:hypothetical protein
MNGNSGFAAVFGAMPWKECRADHLNENLCLCHVIGTFIWKSGLLLRGHKEKLDQTSHSA